MDLHTLKRASLPELEAIFAEASPDSLEVPRGVFRGITLRRLDTPAARAPLVRLGQGLLFELLPFGIDFRSRRWFFFHPCIRAGHFETRVGPSRWRDTEAVQLHYAGSRLPGPIRDVLYDEVKPISPHLALGLGGTNAEVGRGDHFFFALVPW